LQKLRGLFLCAAEKNFGIDRTFLFCVFPEKMELEFGKNGFQVRGLRFQNCEKPGINQISGGGTTFWCAGGVCGSIATIGIVTIGKTAIETIRYRHGVVGIILLT
jgi:hypothetical protein